MAKRRVKKTSGPAKPEGRVAALRKALGQQKKAELIDILVELAGEDRRLLRRLTEQFDVATPPPELIAATRQAIAEATDFDERDINRNFDIDYDAYAEAKRNLDRLIKLGQLRPALDLSLELMKQGSYQVEMSDEGLMTEEIEECLAVVIKSLPSCGLPADEVIQWCQAMHAADRVGFIADRELSALRRHVEASATK